jgi:hypothetical protein
VAAFYHVGLIVENLQEAMDELSQSVGLHWEEPHDSEYGSSRIRVTMSIEGPPFIELIQGEPGGLWDTSQGSRMDHIGFWAEDLESEKQKLSAAGMVLDFDSAHYGFGTRGSVFSYHRSPKTGLRIELIGLARVAAMFARRGLPSPAEASTSSATDNPTR